MKLSEPFKFQRARRITAEEVEANRRAIEKKTGKKRQPRRGRPPKVASERYRAISIRLDPAVFTWAKAKAKRKRIGYQTVINEELLSLAKR